MTDPILVAGEALYDIVASAGGTPALTGHAGGGPFNVARTLGRLGQPVAFLGRLSTDRLGMTHAAMLAADGVGLDSVVHSADPTTLALASLDADGVASWSFYAEGTAAAGLTSEAADAALPPRVAALHVGTLGLVLEPLATAVQTLVERLASQTMVVVDPNVRPQAIGDAPAFRARLERVLARSDLVKVSEEDVAWLDPGSSAIDAAQALLTRGPRAVLLTRGAAGATVLTADGRETAIDAVNVEVADTIGAGDAFGGGVLAWWVSHGLGREQLAAHERVVTAARFGAAVAARTVAAAGASPPQLPAAVRGRPLTNADVAQP